MYLSTALKFENNVTQYADTMHVFIAKLPNVNLTLDGYEMLVIKIIIDF